MGKQVTPITLVSVRLSDNNLQKIGPGGQATFVFTDAEFAALPAAVQTALGATTNVADPVRGGLSGTTTPVLFPTTTTANRPSAAGRAGQCLYDVTLGLPIFSNGTVWKNAAGVTV